MTYEHDVFISHASEDKDSFVRPLAQRLQNRGYRVWYDEFSLRLGDSLRRSIDYGLANSKYGIVVISPNFLRKEWPQRELDGLTAREIDGKKVILPIWHEVNFDNVVKYSPTLADKLAAKTSQGLDCVVIQIVEVISSSQLNLSPVSSNLQSTLLPNSKQISQIEDQKPGGIPQEESLANAIVEKLEQETPSQRQLDSGNRIGNSDFTKSLSSDQIVKEQESLSGEQRRKLQYALIDAFPTPSSLEQMLSFSLNKNLYAIAGSSNLKGIVFNLIITAEAEGWLQDLVRAARESNPGNPRLLALDLQPRERNGSSIVETEHSNQQSSPTQNNPIPGQNYKVQPGDTLMSIALKAYRKGNLYLKIQNANKDLIGNDPHSIKPGMLLYIP